MMKQAQGSQRGKRMVVKIFRDEEVKMLSDFRRTGTYVEVKCGCTSRKFGDTPGKLRVYSNGLFLISCECNTCYKKVNLMTPYEFEKHSNRVGGRNWTKHIWVEKGDKKVPLWRTVLVKYYKHVTNEDNGTCMSQRKRKFHRDEFLRCPSCNIERRFRLRNKEECRIYHDALKDGKWNCGNMKMECEENEERASRKSCRGCPRSPSCKGCTTCVCFGCLKCRFLGCNCRLCVDFLHNAEP